MKIIAPTLLLLFTCIGCKQPSQTKSLFYHNKKLTAIPDSVFTLTQLESLQFGNGFTSYPPLSALGDNYGMSDSANRITEIPKEIRQLSHLRSLGFTRNDLRSIPEEIVSLRNLDTLNIAFNEHLRLADIQAILKQMQWLKYLSIVGIDTSRANIEELRQALPNTTIEARFEDIIVKLPH